FFLHHAAPTLISTLSLHDALPISFPLPFRDRAGAVAADVRHRAEHAVGAADDEQRLLGDGRGEELPRLAHLLGAAGELPRLRERSEEHTSELQSLAYLVCRLLLEK